MKLAVLFCLVAVAVARPHHRRDEEDVQTQFVEWVQTYNKLYANDELFNRFNIFKFNLDIINQHNAGNHTFTMGLNEFSDMTNEEFVATMTGRFPDASNEARETVEVLGDVPNDVDWRSKGIVNPVKNQGQCGSCWAFSATGAVEGFHAQKTGKLLSLSEQQIVDCCHDQGSSGCNGGQETAAVGWVGKQGGQCLGADYPYTARAGTCKTTCTKTGKVNGVKRISGENALITAIDGTVVTVAVCASGSQWQSYKSGIMDFACAKSLNHAILAVGYASNYYIVRNSWGASWGQGGYVMMVRGKNLCGIGQEPSYAI
jgi:C1A family cysteine protease